MSILIHGLDDAMAAASNATLKALKARVPELAESVAKTAAKRWYGRGGVQRVTGQSGQIRALIEPNKLVAHVGSVDKRDGVEFVRSRKDGQVMVNKYLVRPMRARARRLARKLARDLRG